MSGRFGTVAQDDFESRLQGDLRLWERAGTPGEKQAAGEALRRMGVDPDKLGVINFMKGLAR